MIYEISDNWGQYIDIEIDIPQIKQVGYSKPVKHHIYQKKIDPIIEEEYDAYDYYQSNMTHEEENIYQECNEINKEFKSINLIKVGSITFVLAYFIFSIL